MPIQTPDWVKNAVFYQIFPDRFARSERMTHPPQLNFKPWGSDPAEQGFQGGDLYGVIDNLDYLQSLGVNALYFNPVFASAENHRYHTYDYYQVDPLLGGNEALRELLDEAHKRDMRVVLDGVFNHASRGFWQFHHILETGGNSPYIDWFHIEGWPLRPYQHDAENPANYAGWAGMAMLPEFNTDNPAVREFLWDVGRYWVEFGIDGWRLDVPMEIDDDEFWQEFRRVVKAANPEAYIVGEIWDEAERWLQGDQFDAVMNYIFAWSTMSFFGASTLRDDYNREHYKLDPLSASEFAETIGYMHSLYDWEINQVQLNLLDSHDTARALWIMGEDVSALELSTLYQMTMPGAPCIYYGDEIGMSSGDDPYCREAFPWQDESAWNHDLLKHYKAVIRLRNENPVLRTGDFNIIFAENRVLGFERNLGDAHALVFFNQSERSEDVTVGLPQHSGRTFRQAWPLDANPGNRTLDSDGTLQAVIPARSGLVLIST